MSSKVLVKGENTTETQFNYDGFDRTTGIKIGDVTTSFDYNTDSDRVSKTTNGKVTESILDNGSVSADLIGETLKVFSDDNSVFYQNGVFAYNVINTKGDIIASDGSNGIDYNYNAYGTELYNCSSANPIGYRNYYYDSETGLYYLKARYYDPTTGQFTQEDTVQDDNLQYNLYGYCSANPVLYTDPSGHNVGSMISTMDGAAIDFSIYYNAISIIENREYASFIYKDKITIRSKRKKILITYYSYVKPNKGTKDSSSFPINWFWSKNVVALIHTHGAYDKKYKSDKFSRLDKKTANNRRIPSYIATPIGNLLKYNPKTRDIALISTNIPYDRRHPSRK